MNQDSLQFQFDPIWVRLATRRRPNFQNCFEKLNHSRSKCYGLNLKWKIYLNIVSLLDLGWRSVHIDAQYIIISGFLHHHSLIKSSSNTPNRSPSYLGDDTMDVLFVLVWATTHTGFDLWSQLSFFVATRVVYPLCWSTRCWQFAKGALYSLVFSCTVGVNYFIKFKWQCFFYKIILNRSKG